MRQSQVLGDIKKIQMAGEDDSSFVAAMDVPTFCSFGNTTLSSSSSNQKARRGLEGALCQGPAFVLDNVISNSICEELIQTCEELGFGSFSAGKNHHGALQILVSQHAANSVGQALSRHIDVSQVGSSLVYAGLNRRWRIYRYSPGGKETFAPHIDAGFPPSGLSDDHSLVWDDSSPDQDVVSRLTVLMYLNDDFTGGETKFYQPHSERKEGCDGIPQVIASIRPKAGSVLVFPQAVGEEAVEHARQHWPVHEGAPVSSGNRPKYVIRSDVLFAAQPADFQGGEDEKHLFQYDSLVRESFLQQSPALDRKFVNHLSSLYNPHMGVENIGPFLYSFVRFTKVKQIVEIGAGYTSLWILQALKDNDDELKRIQNLQRDGKCRLLDYPWTIPDIVEKYNDSPSTLQCIDNCLHQKETATGAGAVAKTLGLDSYLQFIRGDAFELAREKDSVDLLWCDFGVGSRMKEFVASAWCSIRPGGFLLCHSTLTNTRTRDWLEAARARKGADVTGIPPDEYVEVSLLEPHKRYQNSVSIFQKRKGSNGENFEEPLFSEYA
jgi:predicted O-methyltransferase YrrM